MPALPLDEAGKYVAGAYGVFVTLILVYVAIMGARLQRIERELQELTELAERAAEGALRGSVRAPARRPPAPLERVRALLARWRKRGRRWNTRPYYPAILDIAGRDARSWWAPARSARARSRDC